MAQSWHNTRIAQTQAERKLSKNKEVSGGQGRNRTNDTRIFSPLLYQLSYLAAVGWTPAQTAGGGY